jgi:hypothetical protein
MSQPTPPASPAPAAPAKSGNRVVIIIVCIVLGFVLLVGGCVSACVYFTAKKAKEFSRIAQKNPVYASLSLAASLTPGVEVLSKDETSGKITVRNKRTGETTVINSNDYTKDDLDQAIQRMTQGAQAVAAQAAAQMPRPPSGATNNSDGPDSGPAGESPISTAKAAAMAGILQKFPDYLPAYPSGTTLEASQNAVAGIRTDSYVFSTGDKLDAVVDYYEKKASAAGFTVTGRSGDSNDFGSTATLTLTRANPTGTLTLTAESKAGGRVQGSIVVTETAP